MDQHFLMLVLMLSLTVGCRLCVTLSDFTFVYLLFVMTEAGQ